MRRLAYWVLVVCLVAAVGSLAACGNNNGQDTSSTASGAGGTEPTATPQTTATGGGTSTTGGGGTASTGGASTTAGGGATGEGSQIFATNCSPCHGPSGEGGGAGPNLQTRTNLDLNRVQEQVRKGGNGMPAFEGKLSDDQIKSVAQFVIQNVVKK